MRRPVETHVVEYYLAQHLRLLFDLISGHFLFGPQLTHELSYFLVDLKQLLDQTGYVRVFLLLQMAENLLKVVEHEAQLGLL